MPITIMDHAIAEHSFRPKGIKVGTELWKSLVAENRIEWKRGYLEGAIDSEIDFPVLDQDIFVHVAPELDEDSFQLPSQAKPNK